VRFEALGPVTVTSEGVTVPLRPAQRRLLASLLLDPGQWITTDTLVDRMWGDTAPATARSTLHVHLSTVRDRIPGVIATGQSGYLLDLDGHSFDVPEFSTEVAGASTDLEAGDYQGAANHATTALQLWRGYPYDELDDVDAARIERVRLTELSMIAGVTLARALIRQERVSEAITHLRRVVGEQPLNEAMWEELIRAYYVAGRQVDALGAYNEAKSILGEELGLEPGPRLRDLEERVLIHDPSLMSLDDLHQGVSGAVGIGSISLSVVPAVDLPAFTTSFVGRSESVRLLAKSIPEQRLITLVGTGGIGKTRMAVEAARRAAPAFADGTYFVGLEAVEDPALIPHLIAEAASLDDVTSAESLTSAIGTRNLLLVLDNCEHLVQASGDLASQLLRGCSSISIVVTSRVPLTIMGESTWPVSPLELPDPEATTAELQQIESVVFFVEAARRVHSEFALGSDNASSVAAICRDLAGIPLALELAASQCDVLTARDLHELLTGPDQLGGGTERDRPVRHRSIDDTVAVSLGLLDPSQRRLFERMAVFAGPVDRFAVSEVCGDPDGDLIDHLRRLAHSSLITVDVTDDRAKYGQLPPLKQAAIRRLGTEELHGLELAHASHFLELAGSPRGTAGTDAERAWFDDIDDAIEEVRAALELTRDIDPIGGLLAAVGLLPYWRWRYRIAEGRHHLRVLRDRVGATDVAGVAASLKAEGTLAMVMSDLTEADRLLTKAFELYARLGDKEHMAVTLNNLGGVAVNRGDLDESLNRHGRARPLFEELGDRNGLAANSLNHGIVELQRGNAEGARTWCLRALDEFRAVSNRNEEAHAMERLSYVAQFEGDVAEARTWIHAAQALYAELGLSESVARTDWMRSMLALDADEIELASQCAAESARAALVVDHLTWWMPALVEIAARTSVEKGESSLAAVLIGAASCFRRTTGMSRPAFAIADHAAFVESLRKRVGTAFPALLARGESMTLRQALSLVVDRLQVESATR
jgi:predicted ATPase/DNA-binding SARP family transcriptional activator